MSNIKKKIKIAKNNELSIYDTIPIENYGSNLLKKMNIDNKMLNKKRKNNQIIEFKIRNNRNGLGFNLNENNNSEKIQNKNNKIIQNNYKSINQKENDILNKNEKKIFIEDNINKDNKNKINIEWIKQGIIVRIINKNSKYYKTKAIVDDILNEKDFSLIMNDKTINIDFSEEDLETVIPEIGEKVLILDKNQIGKLIERNKKENKVIVQNFNDLSIVELTQDDICSTIN